MTKRRSIYCEFVRTTFPLARGPAQRRTVNGTLASSMAVLQRDSLSFAAVVRAGAVVCACERIATILAQFLALVALGWAALRALRRRAQRGNSGDGKAARKARRGARRRRNEDAEPSSCLTTLRTSQRRIVAAMNVVRVMACLPFRRDWRGRPHALGRSAAGAHPKGALASASQAKHQQALPSAAATGDEPSEAPPTAAPAPPPAAASKPAASAADRAEAALRAALAAGGLSALEVALATAPREVWEGGVGAAARDRRDRLLEAQQEAEREAKQRAARLAAAVRAAAASKAREEAVAAAAVLAAAREAAAAAAAKADALERTTAEGGEGGGRRAAGPSEASEATVVPNDYICPITAEIMTDPVTTVDGFTYERTAITEWLRTKDTSPFTGATLETKALIPNLSLRSMIRGFVELETCAAAAVLPTALTTSYRRRGGGIVSGSSRFF